MRLLGNGVRTPSRTVQLADGAELGASSPISAILAVESFKFPIQLLDRWIVVREAPCFELMDLRDDLCAFVANAYRWSFGGALSRGSGERQTIQPSFDSSEPSVDVVCLLRINPGTTDRDPSRYYESHESHVVSFRWKSGHP